MAKFIIEFNESKGCKECPFCKYIESEGQILDFGWYCTKESPNKKLGEAYSFNTIKIPKWCSLSKYEPNKPQNTVDYLIQPVFNHIPKTIKFRAQYSVSKYEEKYMGADRLKEMVEHQLVHSIIDSEAFRQAINFSEIYDEWSENRKFIGELEVVTKDVDSEKQKWGSKPIL